MRGRGRVGQYLPSGGQYLAGPTGQRVDEHGRGRDEVADELAEAQRRARALGAVEHAVRAKSLNASSPQTRQKPKEGADFELARRCVHTVPLRLVHVTRHESQRVIRGSSGASSRAGGVTARIPAGDELRGVDDVVHVPLRGEQVVAHEVDVARAVDVKNLAPRTGLVRAGIVGRAHCGQAADEGSRGEASHGCRAGCCEASAVACNAVCNEQCRKPNI
jgi:hypothetical protein